MPVATSEIVRTGGVYGVRATSHTGPPSSSHDAAISAGRWSRHNLVTVLKLAIKHDRSTSELFPTSATRTQLIGVHIMV
jgi:hypothetical protein